MNSLHCCNRSYRYGDIRWWSKWYWWRSHSSGKTDRPCQGWRGESATQRWERRVEPSICQKSERLKNEDVWNLTLQASSRTDEVELHVLGCRWTYYGQIVTNAEASAETVRLIRTESPGRPPRLSHSSWTLNQELPAFFHFKGRASEAMGCRKAKGAVLKAVSNLSSFTNEGGGTPDAYIGYSCVSENVGLAPLSWK